MPLQAQWALSPVVQRWATSQEVFLFCRWFDILNPVLLASCGLSAVLNPLCFCRQLQEQMKDSHVSDIIEVYEQKLAAFAVRFPEACFPFARRLSSLSYLRAALQQMKLL